jgi:glycosyltransferase involved in cell wall biosynthesis
MLYYDVTDLVLHSVTSTKVTGIQRVILEGLRGLQGRATPFFLSPVTGQWYILNGLDVSDATDLSVFRHLWHRADLHDAAPPETFLCYARDYLAKGGRQRFAAKMYAAGQRLPFATLVNRFVAKTVRRRLSPALPGVEIKPLPKLQSDDVIVLFGTPWHFQSQYEEFARQRPAGLETVVLIYDLIPLVSPYVPDSLREKFRRYIPFALKTATKVVVNSDNTADDVRAFARSEGMSEPEIVKVQLAHKLPPLPERAPDKSLRVRKLLSEKFALCVGSIESRKNHLNLLVTWAKFFHSSEYQGEKLVLAGRWLWDVEAVQTILHGTGFVYGSVIMIDHPSDEELDDLYRACRFTAYPSHYEGWGLPVGESLSYGKPCLHFDNSSLVEAGYGMSDAVPYQDLGAYYTGFIRLMGDEDYYQNRLHLIRAQQHRLRSWHDFSLDVERVLLGERAPIVSAVG